MRCRGRFCLDCGKAQGFKCIISDAEIARQAEEAVRKERAEIEEAQRADRILDRESQRQWYLAKRRKIFH